MSNRSFADGTAEIPRYETVPGLLDFLPNAFMDVPQFAKNANPIDHPKEYLGVLGLTGILVYYDQEIIDSSQDVARKYKLITNHDSGSESQLVTTKKIAGVDADLRLPKGPNGTMYYIGDGITSLSIVAGLLWYGLAESDKRALNTTSQIMESMVLTGMFVISGKYTTGRESPFQRSRDGGAWRPLPGVRNYLSSVSKHDAFPSGHVATVTSTLMVLHQNYPEKEWILPTGYGALGLLMFAMLNNGVHWAGDYPVGIAIGYLAAKSVYEKRGPIAHKHSVSNRQNESLWEKMTITPVVTSETRGLLFDLKV